jgi:casein kinase II subunit beta
MIESSAQTLYALIHQRFLNTKSGLLTYKERYEDQEFGTCPRSGCNGIALIPVGLSDLPGEVVKCYCPRCHDIYHPRQSKFTSIDGCHFGTTFAHNLFVTYPELVDFSLSEYEVAQVNQVYEPKIYGFKVSTLSAIGPQMTWLRYQP